MLSAAQQREYENQGYLVLEGFKTSAQIKRLRERAMRIVDDFDVDSHRTIFTTDQQLDHVDQYFLDSATGINCFFEADAFDQHGMLRQDKHLSINKIGHAMHDIDPQFHEFSTGTALKSVAAQLGITDAQLWQSMYIFKQPTIGGAVNWHQDATFFHTKPVSVTTFWFALEDAGPHNGCLCTQPGAHRGPLRERFTRDGDQVTLTTVDSTPWPSNEDAVALEVEAGSLVVFHGLLPHYSEANRSPLSRHAYTLHVTDATTHYSSRNWIQRTVDFPVCDFATRQLTTD